MSNAKVAYGLIIMLFSTEDLHRDVSDALPNSVHQIRTL